ncbi:hypothetical protein [Chitinophaga nivalis]|uniref:Lipocalin-like domain-containing protein n=1 Tax=Chitinophaga nivalis TaxID=2991709 RepID=A0ABT3IH60_9BACT|nr:hypothetical protein [Chitinophaga nivalis]MCW3467007.1 hypothetical protein [Chitinophaga nivalis]MCW3483302.1 hypothetical protein [Chitinophaga nivalis]
MISLTGEWQGYYIYDPAFGEKLSAEKVLFKLSLTDTGDDHFEGVCHDVNSPVSQNNTATIKGFVEDDFISFTKAYRQFFLITDDNQVVPHTALKTPELSYYGHYDPINEVFSGDWELIGRLHAHPDGDYAEITTGTWEMRRG